MRPTAVAGCAPVGHGCVPRHRGTPSGLAAIVRSYRAQCARRALAELETFGAEPSLSSAVRRASFATTPDGKRYHHQRRLSTATLEALHALLRRAPLARCRSFHELHTMVRRVIGPVPGVGRLMIYDTALRIGAKLGLEPERVYLHAGTRDGARNLGLDWRAESVEMKELPAELRRLKAHQVEDVLCIYKDRLMRGAA
jgi:hypothetical protein